MGRYRSRSRSYSPRRHRSPPRHHRSPPRRHRHYDDPRESSRASRSYRDRRSPAPSGLLVRNIALDARPEDLRVPFERFGPIKDVYLPKNYYTGDPRGFGFVKFRNGEDAAEAKHHLNHTVIGGREITIVFAEENRKTPQEMNRTTRVSSRSGGSYRRRSPPRSPRRRHASYSPSPSPSRHRTRDRARGARDDHSRSHSRSLSRSRSRSISQSLSPRDDMRSKHRSPSPNANNFSPDDKRGHRPDQRSASPRKINESPIYKRDNGSRRKSISPKDNGKGLPHSPSRSRSRSPQPRSRSPRPRSYSR